VFLPSSCPGCRTVGPAPCGACVALLRGPPALIAPPGLDSVVTLFSYEGVGAELVCRLKYSNHRDAVVVLARALAGLVPPGADVVTWVPTTPSRRRSRSFDQAELIARSVGRELGAPTRRLLRRVDNRPQTGRSRDGRREGLDLVMSGVEHCPPGVLLIDDVRTTGTSLSSAARALRAGGAQVVVGGTLAATPVSSPDRRSVTEPRIQPLRSV